MKTLLGVIGMASASLVLLSLLPSTAQAPIPIPSVWLQNATPGTTQTGNMNISGRGLFGTAGVGLTNPSTALDVLGTIELSAAGGTRLISLAPFSAFGGSLEGYQEDGTTRTFAFEADASGVGGYLSVFSNSGGAFFVDGAVGAAGFPRISMTGTSDFTFNTNVTGDATAILPADAISAGEILDEPGIAHIGQNSVGTTLSTTATYTVVSSRSLTVPADGYCVVMATMETLHTHVTGTETNVTFGVSDNSTSLPATADMGVRYAAANPSGTLLLTNNTHGVFPVTAGANTFYLLARMISGAGQSFDTELTIMYFPTAYGATLFAPGGGNGESAPNNGEAWQTPGNPGLTQSQIDDERKEEILRHLKKLEEEQARVRKQMAEIRRSLGNR